jgi:class 3 adenylate cyclase
VALDGQWLFDGEPRSVPAGLTFADGSPFGTGTYQLTLHLPAGSPALALRLPIIGTAYELAIDGHVVERRGVVGTDLQDAVPFYRPALVMLPVGSTDPVLTIKVSNWFDQFAGIYYPIRLGPVQTMVAEREQAALVEALVFGAIFLMGLYHLGFFFFRTKNRAPLWFALLCISIALRSTLYSEVIFLDAFPDASWWVIIRGVYLTMTVGVLSFVLYLKHVFPHLAWKPIEIAAYVVCGVFGAFNLLAPLSWTTATLALMQLFIVAAGVDGLVMVVRALKRKEAGAVLFVTGISVFLVTLVLDILKTWWFLPFPSLVNGGMLIFLLMQALVVTKQFSNAFSQVEQINQSLERFIPREVLGFLNKTTITEIGLGDYAELQMTVFFLDIRDFTALSETMTPQQNFRFINSFLKLFGPVIRQHNGFVDKYLGDGLMALFPGAPDDAVRAALNMRDKLQAYNTGRLNGGYNAIRFGIGIHSGPLMLGTIGENRRMDSTVISDTVNAASRLEGLTKKYACDILVSGATVGALKDKGADLAFEFVANETVKGKTKAIDVYRVLP